MNKIIANNMSVFSWNKKEPFIVSGGDDGVVKVWDLRQIQAKKSVAMFKHHSGPITSIEWCPQDSSVFAASGEDNQVTQVKKLTGFWGDALQL